MTTPAPDCDARPRIGGSRSTAAFPSIRSTSTIRASTTLPPVGASALLARIELPPQYCGVLEYFSQFTDLFGRRCRRRWRRRDLRWQILANRQPLSPYHQLATILNPWGFGSFQFSLRMPEGAVVELVVRRIASAVNASGKPITRVGGRLLGRFWYNPAYGSAR